MPNAENIIPETKKLMEKAITSMNHDFASVRTGKASPGLVEGIMVEYYGTQTRMKDLAGITAPEPRLLVIQPWDQNAVKAIEKAIRASDLGISPVSDGRVIRLPIPELSEERRKDMTKLVKKRSEEARVEIRNARRDANDAIKKAQKASEITEDEMKSKTDEVQKMTDKMIEQVNKILEDKDRITQVVCMLQKEVAERLASGPGGRDYGILSVLLQTWYDIEYLFTVDESAFVPPPKIKSGVIRLWRNTREELECSLDVYKNIIKTTFGQRRKTLRNSIRNIISPDIISQYEEGAPLLDKRPEQLGVEDFINLALIAEENKNQQQ